MTDLEKAARLALEALESIDGVGDVVRWHKQFEYFGKATTDLRQALEQPAQQEPVGYVYSVHGERIKNACIESDVPNGAPVYTSPQSKPWVGLTVEEIKNTYFTTRADFVDYARAIEAKLKEKNT